jgi:hypothetical protein
MKITILGSCRQDSLYDHYQVTNIKNNLTYPHYSKEVIQAIEFCKGISTIPYPLTQSLFRSGILNRGPISSLSFNQEYNETDLFVIEIASRISYMYKGHWAHHILSESQYGCQDIETIEIRDLTDEEIEADLLHIKKLIAPKPMIIIGHIYTRTTGKRYELVQLLKTLCDRHSIPFFDPVEHTKEYSPNELYQKNELLSHYTSNGYSIIGKKYIEFIHMHVPII